MPPQRSTGNVTASALRGRRSREKTKSKLEALEEENKALKAQNAVLTSKLQRISLCIQCAAIANEALSISNLVVPWSPPSVATVDPDKAAPSDIGGVAPVLEAESLGNEGPVRLGFQPFAASPVAHISETYDMPYALNLAFDGPESLLSAHTYGACSAYEHGTTVVSTNQSAQTLGSEEMSPVGHFAMPSSALSDSSNLYQAVTPPLNTFPMSDALELFKSLAWKVYFFLVNISFEIYNHFQTKEVVSKPRNPLLLLSAQKLVQKLKAKEVTSTDIVKAFIKRIEEVNPIINAAVCKNFEEALDKAQKCDEELENVEANSEEMEKIYAEKPLFGVPFTVKDSMEYKGLNVTCGVTARKGIVSKETAPTLQKVSNAGAILLALTNVPELCMWVESSNHVYGRSKNPYDSRRGVGGSSGGEGALLSAAGSVIGIGSDIGGSIRIPSLFNGVFGIKTTQDLVDAHLHIPKDMDKGGIRKELAVIGPMCRYAEDLPIMLKAMAPEVYGPMKVDEPMKLEGLRAYYITHLPGNEKEPVDWEIAKGLKNVVRHLEMDVGMRTERVHFDEMADTFNMWLAAMDGRGSGYPTFAEHATNYKYSLNLSAELIKAMIGQSDHTVAAIVGGIAEANPPFDFDGRDKLLERLRTLRTQIHNLLADNAILVFPGWNTPAPYHNQLLLTPNNCCYTALWNIMSTPVAVCPLGLNRDGIPVGCQIVGAPNSERLLVSVAQELERKFGGWTPPGTH
ncbi:hypothetical protein QR680_011082 [Steinernema hermaphroditum]|uniref:Amidase domain-containing protein n=1 Tax=Steinernema hermaphroditum TaxID=289476 RepID=A0AA39ITJ9_9BILA|nr:hypothetical protein QR680_011082 [Steinernema hermaphroditum]